MLNLKEITQVIGREMGAGSLVSSILGANPPLLTINFPSHPYPTASSTPKDECHKDVCVCQEWSLLGSSRHPLRVSVF